MSTNAVCPVCGNPQAQGLLDDSCTTRLERDLGDVASIVADLDVTLSRQAKIGASGKSGKGWAREKLPIHIGAIEAADVLANTLTTWARDICGVRGSVGIGSNPSQVAARYLLMVIPEIRKHPAVVELVDEITDAIKQARRVVDRPADRVYFGTCLSETPDEDGRTITCIEEIWASPSASDVQCKVCLAAWDVAERRKWLMRKAEDMLVTVKEASSYLGEVGDIHVTEARIRGYIFRSSNPLAYRPGPGKVFRLGDLLDMVMDDSEKKSA